jgi:hypothetical protein
MPLWISLRSLLVALALAILLVLALAAPALASVHTYHEQPGQTTYRSRQSLRDQTDMAWQATLFKRYVGEEFQGAYLRLVGFPGRATVDWQRPLLIETGTATQWLAPTALDPQTQALPDNVVQYDLATVLSQLPQPIPLTLAVPQAQAPAARLVVAPYVVAEWLEVWTMPEE